MPGVWAFTPLHEGMALTTPARLSGAAFGTLLLIAFMMGANHVAARTAFNHGLEAYVG